MLNPEAPYLMKMVKLRFKHEADDAAGALALAKHFKVICLPGDVYEVPGQALTLLDTLHLSYTLLETEGFDLKVDVGIGPNWRAAHP